MGKITKENKIIEALQFGNQEAVAEVLYSFGMHCLGCAMSRGETLEEAAAVHGIDVDELVEAINDVLK
ncbi:MAG: DUF1858 domain-containing protein [Christensenellales bacterium]|jgi:hybrid cluster-associated redox disulfide protein|nr:DUF1858 domain-containing protein [Clostridiales bacterium]